MPFPIACLQCLYTHAPTSQAGGAAGASDHITQAMPAKSIAKTTASAKRDRVTLLPAKRERRAKHNSKFHCTEPNRKGRWSRTKVPPRCREDRRPSSEGRHFRAAKPGWEAKR